MYTAYTEPTYRYTMLCCSVVCACVGFSSCLMKTSACSCFKSVGLTHQISKMLRLLLTTAALCVGTLHVEASSEWAAPKEININAPHEHKEDHPTSHQDHNIKGLSSEVKHWKQSNNLPTCPSSRPDSALISDMYSHHRNKAVSAAGAQPGDAIVLFGGDLEFRSGSDTEILFRQISSVWYMANLDLYNCILFITVGADGHLNTTALVERQTRSQDIFNGFLPPFEVLASDFSTDFAGYVDELDVMLQGFLDSWVALGTPTVFTDNSARLEAAVGGVPMNVNDHAMPSGIDQARCVKDSTEVAMLRYSSEVAGAAHMASWKATKHNPSISEMTLEAAFVGTSQTCGLRFQAYIPIVAAGKNGAVLHYYKAEANAKLGEVLLLDAAPELQGYCSDVTRTYPVSGVFTDKEKVVYNAVLASADAGIRAMKVGADWNVDVCYGSESAPGAYWALTEALVASGFVHQGDASMKQLVFGDSANGVPRVWGTFLPHSLGHGVGLNVHDLGVTSSGCGTKLAVGHVMTVEPGIYFIDELLDEACAGADAHWYNCSLMDSYRGFGGVRLEDVVVVTEDEPDCLSCDTPRTTEAIEAAFAAM